MVQPITEMQNQMKLIRKTIVKRDHKMQDYDRFRISLKKLQDKKERTLSDEKQIFKVRLSTPAVLPTLCSYHINDIFVFR